MVAYIREKNGEGIKTIFGGHILAGTYGEKLNVGVYDIINMVVQELPSRALLIYQSYIVSLVFIGSPRSVMNFFIDNNLEAPMALTSMISFVVEMMMHWRWMRLYKIRSS